MASGTITNPKSATSGRYIESKIEWSSVSDSDSNCSDVTAKLYVKKGDTNQNLTIPTEGAWSYSLTVNGSNVSGTAKLSVLQSWVLVATKTVRSIAHADDGTKSIAISGFVTAPSVSSLKNHKSSGSGMADLGVIPRSSTITAADDAVLGGNSSIKWIPASADFRYKLEFSIGNWKRITDAIHPNRTSAYTYTGVIPLEAASQIPTSIGTMTVTLYTYSDSGATKQIGSADSEAFKVTVPDNSETKPTVAMVLNPVGSLPGAFNGLYIQGKTKVQATLSAEGKHGASIRSYSIKVDRTTYGSESGYTSGFLNTASSITVYGYATDSRGYTGSVSQNITVIGYSSPKIMDVYAKRCDSDGNLTDSGTYLKIKAKRSYSPVVADGNQKNFCQIRYRYKSASAASYSAWTTILARNNLNSDEVITNAMLGGVLAVNSSYLVQVQAVDDIGGTADTTIVVPTDKVHTHKTKNGMGLGKYCEGEDLLDVGWDAHFHGDVKVGNMTLKDYILSVVNEGG
jgi:hypothetical protein